MDFKTCGWRSGSIPSASEKAANGVALPAAQPKSASWRPLSTNSEQQAKGDERGWRGSGPAQWQDGTQPDAELWRVDAAGPEHDQSGYANWFD